MTKQPQRGFFRFCGQHSDLLQGRLSIAVSLGKKKLTTSTNWKKNIIKSSKKKLFYIAPDLDNSSLVLCKKLLVRGRFTYWDVFTTHYTLVHKKILEIRFTKLALNNFVDMCISTFNCLWSLNICADIF